VLLESIEKRVEELEEKYEEITNRIFGFEKQILSQFGSLSAKIDVLSEKVEQINKTQENSLNRTWAIVMTILTAMLSFSFGVIISFFFVK